MQDSSAMQQLYTKKTHNCKGFGEFNLNMINVTLLLLGILKNF